jgi:hypothetical protein
MAEITIHDILAQFGEEALNNLYLGDRIGRLSTRFSNLWTWKRLADEGHSRDTSIDFFLAINPSTIPSRNSFRIWNTIPALSAARVCVVRYPRHRSCHLSLTLVLSR